MKRYMHTPTIGLEIHTEIKTKTKMFCDCLSFHFRKSPNTLVCPVCLGLPGAMPYANLKAIDMVIKTGIALNCKINKKSKFDRKHYFYPDLPKGYQISQYDMPFCEDGFLDTEAGRVRITRVHLEEDTGKLIHKKIQKVNVSMVDFNRSGVPLMEIVTEPDIKNTSQAKDFAKKLTRILRYLDVSDCDMEKGSMRLEANVSMGVNLGYKVEVKNLNSYKFIEKAINYEIKRQKDLFKEGKTPRQETRGFDELSGKTVHQRYKETSADYRYFPEPDIPPVEISNEKINIFKASIPELPEVIEERFLQLYGLNKQYTDLLLKNKSTAIKADELFSKALKNNIKPIKVANLLINKKINPEKDCFEDIFKIVKTIKIKKISDKKMISGWIKKVIKENPKALEDYKKGKVAALTFLVGAVIRLSEGKADPVVVKNILEETLKK